MDNVPEFGHALGFPEENAPASGLNMLGSGFSMKDFIENYEPRDSLDEALQPVFEVLAREFPGHRLVVTASGASLEKHSEVGTYVNIAAARVFWGSIDNQAFGAFLQGVCSAGKVLSDQRSSAETQEAAP